MQQSGVPAGAPSFARPGEILLGKYRVEDVIGIGGMGCVVRASHLYLQQPVAIKILLPQMVESQSTVQRFMREAQATVKLRSEHIARVMDVSTLPDGTPVMVMEYLEGYDLNQILRHHGPQMPQAVVDLILQACEGISEAHALGIIHRDIKPSNFFVTVRPDGSNLLKILDFGISKAHGDGISELTGTQTVIGTPTYMAPEQMQTARSTDPRSDIWSMGVVMYQMLAGRPPFEAENYAQLVLMVASAPPAPLTVPLPGGLQSIVFRCLEKDPKNRIQNVGELAKLLAPYASDPQSAQQIASRAQRILAGGGQQRPSAASIGGLSQGGINLTPPALTPKSWNQNGTSVSGGAGQMGTKVVRSGRGLVIGGVAALCVLAGVGGFAVSHALKSDAPDTSQHVNAPETAPAAAAAPTPAPAPAPAPAPTPAPTIPTAPPPATDTAAKTDTAKTDATTPKPATETKSATVTATKPATETKPATVTTTKPATETKPATTHPTTTHPTTTKPTTTKPKSDDLFGDRH